VRRGKGRRRPKQRQERKGSLRHRFVVQLVPRHARLPSSSSSIPLLRLSRTAAQGSRRSIPSPPPHLHLLVRERSTPMSRPPIRTAHRAHTPPHADRSTHGTDHAGGSSHSIDSNVFHVETLFAVAVMNGGRGTGGGKEHGRSSVEHRVLLDIFRIDLGELEEGDADANDL
jgi:hypothetical protein